MSTGAQMLKKIRNFFLISFTLFIIFIIGIFYVLSSDTGDSVDVIKEAKVNMNNKMVEMAEQQRKETLILLAENLGYDLASQEEDTEEVIKDDASNENVLVANEQINQEFSSLEIAYFYDHSSAPDNLSKKEVLDSINKASNQWKEACNISFVYKGDRLSDYVTIETTLNRKEGIIKWGELEGDAIGMAHQGTTKSFAEGFVLLLNPEFFEQNKQLVHATVLHELGHVVGLDHNQNKKSVMYESQSHMKQTLSETDKALCRYFRARWSGMKGKEASEKYGILINEV